MKSVFFFNLFFLIFLGCNGFAQDFKWVQKPTVEKNNEGSNGWVISFETNQNVDVEVSVLSSENKVLNHLAAGMLGEKAPDPLQKNSMKQVLKWDGKDDYGVLIKDTSKLKVRVRVGLQTKLDQILGGDPYAFYSREMGQGDHACWRLKGIEAKSDGKVYVIGNTNTYGVGVIRGYTAEGDYSHTVFPPPAGKDLQNMKGWGVIQKEDGSYSFKFNDLGSPSISELPVIGHRGKLAYLVPSNDSSALTLMDDQSYQLMKINVDGTVVPQQDKNIFMVNKPELKSSNPRKENIFGEIFSCSSLDHKSLYLSGIYKATVRGWHNPDKQITSEFWRDGRIYKMDLSTREAQIFYELPEVLTDNKEREARLGDTSTSHSAAFHGIAIDGEENIFICDRQNKRVLVLNKEGKPIKELAVDYPDAISISKNSKNIFVTTRIGHYHNRFIDDDKNYELKLLKFEDWSKDSKPSFEQRISSAGMYPGSSYITIAEKSGVEYVWVGYNVLSVQIFKNKANGLELVKDFSAVSKQKVMDFQYLEVDSELDHIYIGDGFGKAFRMINWEKPEFENLVTKTGQIISSVDIVLDSKNRILYARSHGDKKMKPYKINADLSIEDFDKTQGPVTDDLSNDWRISLGFGTRGGACSPKGDLATLGSLQRNDYSGPLIFWEKGGDLPWKKTPVSFLGEKPRSGGVRFDLKGNLYVGLQSKYSKDQVPAAFVAYGAYMNQNGKIIKIAPTGSMQTSLYSQEPKNATKEYSVPYGPFAGNFTRTPRFAVDGYGRIYSPDALYPRVTIVDNEDNKILQLGTYGNLDSRGGLEGDQIATKGIPMAWPNAVAVSEKYIYVGDIVNSRILKIQKTYKSEEVITIK